MSIDSLGPTAATIGGSFFVSILIGYALKKVIKLLTFIFYRATIIQSKKVKELAKSFLILIPCNWRFHRIKIQCPMV